MNAYIFSHTTILPRGIRLARLWQWLLENTSKFFILSCIHFSAWKWIIVLIVGHDNGRRGKFRTNSFQSLWTDTLFRHVTDARHEFRKSHICRIRILNGEGLLLILFWLYWVDFKCLPAGGFEFIKAILDTRFGNLYKFFQPYTKQYYRLTRLHIYIVDNKLHTIFNRISVWGSKVKIF